MSTEKLSELSKPAAFIVRSPRGDVAYRTISQTDADYIAQKGYESEPLYSQEYVSALLARIEELGQAMRHIHGAALDITVPRTAIAKAAEFAAEHAAMKEQSNG